MRTNVLTTAKRIRRHLRTGYRNEQTTLNGALPIGAATLAVTNWYPSIQPGVTLAIDTELVRVISVNVIAQNVTVLRGYFDTDAAVHADGALVDIAPRFTLVDTLDAMQSEVASWSPELYYVDDQTLSVATTATTLELPVGWANILGIVALNQSEGATNTVWPEVGVKFIRGSATGFNGAATSGQLLRFLEPIRTGSVHIIVAISFDSTLLADPTKDLISDVHMGPGLVDVLELGAQRRLIAEYSDYSSSRASQDEPRRETQAAANPAPLMGLNLGVYTRAKANQVSLLRRRYPLKMTG